MNREFNLPNVIHSTLNGLDDKILGFNIRFFTFKSFLYQVALKRDKSKRLIDLILLTLSIFATHLHKQQGTKK